MVLLQSLDKNHMDLYKLLNSSLIESGTKAISEQKIRKREKKLLSVLKSFKFTLKSLFILSMRKKRLQQRL